MIPAGRIVPQARALLGYYPLPNAEINGANYQAPVVTATTQDSLQIAMNGNAARRNAIAATLAFQRTAADSAGLFGFLDSTRQSSVNATASWNRRVSPRLSWRLRYQFTRAATDVRPFFANRTNVSAEAGIEGNNQDPENWGPPTLSFPDLAGLADANYQRSVKTGHGGGGDVSIRRGLHTFTIGGDLRRNLFDLHSQPDPRGTLTFTGIFTGDAFADFLLGLPAASALAYGETATRLRGRAGDAYVTDDWRATPTLTLNLGVRWEYESPYTEAADHLVNLEVAPGFAAITPVAASQANRSLIAPDRRGIQPRLAASWRPTLGSSLVIRAGYGIYRNLGTYDSIALLLAHQPPFSRTFSIQNSAADAAHARQSVSLRSPGHAEYVRASIRSCVPHRRTRGRCRRSASCRRSLTVIAAYLGTAGRHLMQAFLPNTYPAGAIDPCPACPSGFVYVTSTGTSLRNAAQFTLRRRLHNGLTATVQYTLSRSTDDAATFSNTADHRRSRCRSRRTGSNLAAERGSSSFDQRHLLSVQVQYTTGMGIAGGTLVEGRWAALFKDWTIAGQLTAGSGLPFTPISFTSVAGTGRRRRAAVAHRSVNGSARAGHLRESRGLHGAGAGHSGATPDATPFAVRRSSRSTRACRAPSRFTAASSSSGAWPRPTCSIASRSRRSTPSSRVRSSACRRSPIRCARCRCRCGCGSDMRCDVRTRAGVLAAQAAADLPLGACTSSSSR